METAQHTNNNFGEGQEARPYCAGQWPKGRDLVKVTVSEFKGKPVLDLRAWYLTASGEWKPGPKGLTLALDALPRLALALESAHAFALAHGLLQEGGEQ